MAPALRAFGRRWHSATDDFFIPAAVGFFFHLAILAILIVLTVWLPRGALQCTDSDPVSAYQAYIGGLVGLDAIMAILLAWLTAATVRGSILDVHLRKDVPAAVTITGLSYFIMLGLNIFGTQTYYSTDRASCVPQVEEASVSSRALLLLAIWSHWAALGGVLGCLVLGWNCFQDHQDVRSWERRCACLSFLLCCKPNQRRKKVGSRPPVHHHVTDDGVALEEELATLQDTQQLSPVASLAAVFAYFYSHVDLTLSDIVTALMLVGIQQRISRLELHKRQVTNDHTTPTTITNNTSTDNTTNNTSIPSHRQSDSGDAAAPHNLAQALLPGKRSGPGTTGSMDALGAAAGLLGADSPAKIPVQEHVLDDACYYFKYAFTVYGWPMYVWMAARQVSIKDCCQICPGFCGCCTKRRHHPALQGLSKLNVTRSLNLEAFHTVTSLEPESHLLLLCTEDEAMSLLPYQVSVNPDRKELIIAVRGSLSQHDVVTDLVCEPAVVPVSWLSGGKPVKTVSSTIRLDGQETEGKAQCDVNEPWSLPSEQRMVHRGMLCCAQEVLEHLNASGVLSAVLNGDKEALSRLTPLQQALLESLGTGPASTVDPPHQTTNTTTQPSSATVDASQAAVHNQSSTEPSQPQQQQASDAIAPATVSMSESSDQQQQQQTRLQGSRARRLSGWLSSALGSSVRSSEQTSTKHPLYGQDWKIVVVGHSLGAGVGTLLAMHLKQAWSKHDVSCWAFSPPGGLLTTQLSSYMKPFCTSVVIGRDMIPRLTLGAMHKMHQEMLEAAAMCKVSKAWLWFRTLMGKEWTREELFKRREDVPQEVWAVVNKYKEGMESSASAPRFQAALNFCMPGRVLYYECMNVDDPDNLSDGAKDQKKVKGNPALLKPLGANGVHGIASYAKRSIGMEEADKVTIHVPDAVIINVNANTANEVTYTTDTISHQPDSPMSLPLPPGIKPTSIGTTTTMTSSARTGSSTPPIPYAMRRSESMFRSWSKQGAAGRNKTFAPCWTTPEHIDNIGLLVSRRMFAMHIPDYQASVMQECLQ